MRTIACDMLRCVKIRYDNFDHCYLVTAFFTYPCSYSMVTQSLNIPCAVNNIFISGYSVWSKAVPFKECVIHILVFKMSITVIRHLFTIDGGIILKYVYAVYQNCFMNNCCKRRCTDDVTDIRTLSAKCLWRSYLGININVAQGQRSVGIFLKMLLTSWKLQ